MTDFTSVLHSPPFFLNFLPSSVYTPPPLAMDQLKIISLNAKGLNIPEKRRMLLHDLKSSHADIAFKQETHLRDDKPPILKKRHYPLTYHSTKKSTKSKGVSILSSTLPWTCRETILDTEGRFAFVKGLMGEGGATDTGNDLCA